MVLGNAIEKRIHFGLFVCNDYFNLYLCFLIDYFKKL